MAVSVMKKRSKAPPRLGRLTWTLRRRIMYKMAGRRERRGILNKFHRSEKLTLFATLSTIVLLSFTSVAIASSSLNSPTQWAIYGETTQPNDMLNFHPIGHGMSFAVPDVTSSSPNVVNYMLDTYTVSLTEGSVITATISVTGNGLIENPLWSGAPYYSPATPAFVRLFIQANLPNDHSAFCVGGNGNVNNYWWAHGTGAYTFVQGGVSTYILTISLDPSNWSGICGNSVGSVYPPGTPNAGSTMTTQAQFDNALANIKYVGLSFGSGSFFADGVGVDGTTGTATFTLANYAIS